jgi:hypothetical protein
VRSRSRPSVTMHCDMEKQIAAAKARVQREEPTAAIALGSPSSALALPGDAHTALCADAEQAFAALEIGLHER